MVLLFLNDCLAGIFGFCSTFSTLLFKGFVLGGTGGTGPSVEGVATEDTLGLAKSRTAYRAKDKMCWK